MGQSLSGFIHQVSMRGLLRKPSQVERSLKPYHRLQTSSASLIAQGRRPISATSVVPSGRAGQKRPPI
jgi:hypothetical protein